LGVDLGAEIFEYRHDGRKQQLIALAEDAEVELVGHRALRLVKQQVVLVLALHQAVDSLHVQAGSRRLDVVLVGWWKAVSVFAIEQVSLILAETLRELAAQPVLPGNDRIGDLALDAADADSRPLSGPRPDDDVHAGEGRIGD